MSDLLDVCLCDTKTGRSRTIAEGVTRSQADAIFAHALANRVAKTDLIYTVSRSQNGDLEKNMTKDDQDRASIRYAMAYRSNDIYMGSMALAELYHILGLSFGASGFDEALNQATRQQLNKLLTKCEIVLYYASRHPIVTCPSCGQTIQKS